MPKGHPLLMLDLLGESKARLHCLQSPCVLSAWPQILPHAQEGVGFGRALTNLTGDLEGSFAKTESVSETARAWHHCLGFIHPA